MHIEQPYSDQLPSTPSHSNMSWQGGANPERQHPEAAKCPRHSTLPHSCLSPSFTQEGCKDSCNSASDPRALGEPSQQGSVLPEAQGTHSSRVSVKMTLFSAMLLLPCLRTRLFAPALEGTRQQLPHRGADQPLPGPAAPWLLHCTAPGPAWPQLHLLYRMAAQALPAWLCLPQGTAPGSCIPLGIALTPSAAQQDGILLQQQRLLVSTLTTFKLKMGSRGKEKNWS